MKKATSNSNLRLARCPSRRASNLTRIFSLRMSPPHNTSSNTTISTTHIHNSSRILSSTKNRKAWTCPRKENLSIRVRYLMLLQARFFQNKKIHSSANSSWAMASHNLNSNRLLISTTKIYHTSTAEWIIMCFTEQYDVRDYYTISACTSIFPMIALNQLICSSLIFFQQKFIFFVRLFESPKIK